MVDPRARRSTHSLGGEGGGREGGGGGGEGEREREKERGEREDREERERERERTEGRERVIIITTVNPFLPQLLQWLLSPDVGCPRPTPVHCVHQ